MATPLTRTSSGIVGMRELFRRLDAVANPAARRQTMTQVGLVALGYIKQETPVKTGNLRRQNRLLRVTATSAVFTNDASYAKAVHDGARAHDIVPRNRKALRWRGRDGQMHFARRVRHPGNKPNRFMTRGLQRAGAEGGRKIVDGVVQAWNRAA